MFTLASRNLPDPGKVQSQLAVFILLLSAKNERTIIKSKIQLPLVRGAEASSRSKRNKWG